MRTALLQLSSSDDPEENLATITAMVDEAAASHAGFVLTPEVSNCVSADRSHQQEVLRHEHEDALLARLREQAAAHGIWLSIGSLALKSHDSEDDLSIVPSFGHFGQYRRALRQDSHVRRPH